MQSHILSIILFTPLLGAFLLMFVPKENKDAIRWIANIFGVAGFLISLRFLYFYFFGAPNEGMRHQQSLILSAVLMIVGFQVILIGLVADVISGARKLLEDLLYRVRRMEIDRAPETDRLKDL